MLGSLVAASGCEIEAINHRVECSWQVFHKWGKILMDKSVSAKYRLDLWRRTALVSLLWCLDF